MLCYKRFRWSDGARHSAKVVAEETGGDTQTQHGESGTATHSGAVYEALYVGGTWVYVSSHRLAAAWTPDRHQAALRRAQQARRQATTPWRLTRTRKRDVVPGPWQLGKEGREEGCQGSGSQEAEWSHVLKAACQTPGCLERALAHPTSVRATGGRERDEATFHKTFIKLLPRSDVNRRLGRCWRPARQTSPPPSSPGPPVPGGYCQTPHSTPPH